MVVSRIRGRARWPDPSYFLVSLCLTAFCTCATETEDRCRPVFISTNVLKDAGKYFKYSLAQHEDRLKLFGCQSILIWLLILHMQRFVLSFWNIYSYLHLQCNNPQRQNVTRFQNQFSLKKYQSTETYSALAFCQILLLNTHASTTHVLCGSWSLGTLAIKQQARQAQASVSSQHVRFTLSVVCSRIVSRLCMWPCERRNNHSLSTRYKPSSFTSRHWILW